MYNPLVTIVIPVYNGSNYLAEAIDSALAQTYNNIEVIVVNDGSNDNGATEQIALSYGDKIKYFSKENGGASSALNLGIKMMKGEWLSWLSHDDLYKPTKVESAINKIIENDFDVKNTIISCSLMHIDKNGCKIPRVCSRKTAFYNDKEMFQKLLLGENLGGCALLIPKVLIDKVKGFDESYKYILDLNMWIDFSLLGANLYIYDEVLEMNRRHKDQITVTNHGLYPIEINKLVSNLFARFVREKKDDWYFKVLLYFCASIKNYEIEQNIIKYLSSDNNYSSSTKLKVFSYKTKSSIRTFLSTCYKKVINNRIHT